MSALLQGVPRRVAGAIRITQSDTPPHHYHNGIPYEADGSIAAAGTAPVTHYHQGLGFTAEGRLATQQAAPDYYNSGAAPIVGANKNMSIFLGAPANYSSGVGYSSGSARVAVTL